MSDLQTSEVMPELPGRAHTTFANIAARSANSWTTQEPDVTQPGDEAYVNSSREGERIANPALFGSIMGSCNSSMWDSKYEASAILNVHKLLQHAAEVEQTAVCLSNRVSILPLDRGVGAPDAPEDNLFQQPTHPKLVSHQASTTLDASCHLGRRAGRSKNCDSSTDGSPPVGTLPNFGVEAGQGTCSTGSRGAGDSTGEVHRRPGLGNVPGHSAVTSLDRKRHGDAYAVSTADRALGVSGVGAVAPETSVRARKGAGAATAESSRHDQHSSQIKSHSGADSTLREAKLKRSSGAGPSCAPSSHPRHAFPADPEAQAPLTTPAYGHELGCWLSAQSSGRRKKAETSATHLPSSVGGAPGASSRPVKPLKVPKLPMVLHEDKWYRARVLKDQGVQVLVEFPGFQLLSGPFWLEKSSERIWRGSYKGKDWRYLGDGAWEPKQQAVLPKKKPGKVHWRRRRHEADNTTPPPRPSSSSGSQPHKLSHPDETTEPLQTSVSSGEQVGADGCDDDGFCPGGGQQVTSQLKMSSGGGDEHHPDPHHHTVRGDKTVSTLASHTGACHPAQCYAESMEGRNEPSPSLSSSSGMEQQQPPNQPPTKARRTGHGNTPQRQASKAQLAGHDTHEKQASHTPHGGPAHGGQARLLCSGSASAVSPRAAGHHEHQAEPEAGGEVAGGSPRHASTGAEGWVTMALPVKRPRSPAGPGWGKRGHRGMEAHSRAVPVITTASNALALNTSASLKSAIKAEASCPDPVSQAVPLHSTASNADCDTAQGSHGQETGPGGRLGWKVAWKGAWKSGVLQTAPSVANSTSAVAESPDDTTTVAAPPTHATVKAEPMQQHSCVSVTAPSDTMKDCVSAAATNQYIGSTKPATAQSNHDWLQHAKHPRNVREVAGGYAASNGLNGALQLPFSRHRSAESRVASMPGPSLFRDSYDVLPRAAMSCGRAAMGHDQHSRTRDGRYDLLSGVPSLEVLMKRQNGAAAHTVPAWHRHLAAAVPKPPVPLFK